MKVSSSLPLACSFVVFGCTSSAPTSIPDPPAEVGAAPTPPVAETPGSTASDAPVSVGDDPAETFPDPVVEEPSGLEERRILALVAPRELAELHRLVGRFARGEAAVFEGTFSARDNMGSLGPAYDDGVMTNSPVNASLAWEEQIYSSGQLVSGWALTVRGPTHRIRIAQSPSAPSVTSFSLVSPENRGGGLDGTCSNCFPALGGAPSTIASTGALAKGKWGDGRALEVAASGALKKIPRSAVTFERIVAVADPVRDGKKMDEFVDAGGDMVRGVEGQLAEPATAPAGTSYYACERTTTYKLDWFVDRARLARLGLRNMSISGTQTCCSDGPPGGCRPQTCF